MIFVTSETSGLTRFCSILHMLINIQKSPERLGRAIGDEAFEQLASVINFRVCGGKFADAKFLFRRVRECNIIADLSLKKYSGLISL